MNLQKELRRLQASEENLIEFVRVRSNTKPYLPV